MRRRRKVSMRRSKKLFRRTAMRVNRRNYRVSPMRGGYRL